VLTGPNLELTAQPGQMYLTANGRTLYVEGGVQVVDGKLVLPLQVLAKATGDQLTWNASTGTAELVCQNAVPASASYDEEDLYWLSRVISAESKGESLTGQIAVGNVVLNRVKSSQYPNSIKEVVFDQKDGVQFEPTSNGSIYDAPTDSAVLAAKLCLEGANVVDDCMYFYAPELSAGTWIVQNCTYYTTIGCHRFYR
jgi:N-acetylmuramoyl-L-alanine amidase